MSEHEKNELEASTSSTETVQEKNVYLSRKTIEIISGILIAVVSFFIGTSTQHSRDVSNLKNYADVIKNAFGSIASGEPTPGSQSDTSSVNQVGQACAFDDGFSINVTSVDQVNNKIRITFQAKNSGNQNIDLSQLNTYYNYGADGIGAKVASNYGISSNPFLNDGLLSPTLTMTRTLDFTGPNISKTNGKIQVSGDEIIWKYAPCNFEVS